MPNPAEELDLIELNAPLLAAVPESADRNVTDPDQTIGMLYLHQSQCAATLNMYSEYNYNIMAIPIYTVYI